MCVFFVAREVLTMAPEASRNHDAIHEGEYPPPPRPPFMPPFIVLVGFSFYGIFLVLLCVGIIELTVNDYKN